MSNTNNVSHETENQEDLKKMKYSELVNYLVILRKEIARVEYERFNRWDKKQGKYIKD